MLANPGSMPTLAILASGMLATATLLGACAEPAFRTDAASVAARTVRADTLAGMREPGAREVVIVINGNANKGVHAGMFAGSRLYDPSGTYARVRSEDKSWRRPSLADYLAYQLIDGPDVRLYRFDLAEQDFNTILARIDHAGWTMPTNCGNSVRDALAGIGPFLGLAKDGWISPKRLAAQLDQIIASATAQASVATPSPAGLPRPASQQNVPAAIWIAPMPVPWPPFLYFQPVYIPNNQYQPN